MNFIQHNEWFVKCQVLSSKVMVYKRGKPKWQRGHHIHVEEGLKSKSVQNIIEGQSKSWRSWVLGMEDCASLEKCPPYHFGFVYKNLLDISLTFVV